MAKPYSIDLRERVIAACEAGAKPEDAGPRFSVSVRCVYNWLKLRKDTGSLQARPQGSGRKPKLATHTERLRTLVTKHPDATLEELRSKLPVKVSGSSLWEALRRLGFSLKKSHSRRRTTET